MTIFYNLVKEEGAESITLYDRNKKAHALTRNSHPDHFDEIVKLAIADNEKVFDTLDLAEKIANKFERLSERVSVKSSRIYFDGDEINNACTEQIVRALKEKADFKALLAFLENLGNNPSENSRDNAYRWMKATGGFTITEDGMIVGYKAVGNDDLSVKEGRAIVDGQVIEGKIPNKPGSVIEMPRSEVTYDPKVGCSTGLHVGTWKYASGFQGPKKIMVLVNPRDIVSVPKESADEKMRVCRYEVIKTVTGPEKAAVVSIPVVVAAEKSTLKSKFFPPKRCPKGHFIKKTDKKCGTCGASV